MTDRNTLVLVDASYLVSGSASPGGGSGYILTICQRGYLRGAVSKIILVEAERNITKKMGSASHTQYFQHLRDIAFEIAVFEDASIPLRHRLIAGEKDAHVITAAVILDAEYVISLDRRLVSRINTATLPITAMTPGEFLRGPLLLHPEYADIRNP